MDRIWQWAWDRHGTRYTWAMCAIGFPVLLPIYLGSSFFVVAFEESRRYGEAAVTVVAVLVLVYVTVLPGLGRIHLVERWAAGDEVDRAMALKATYTWVRGRMARTVGANAVFVALLLVVVGAIAGATGSRLVQYAIMGAVAGTVIQLIAVHSFNEAAWRPARVAIAGDTGIGDSLPRSRPTFAAWSNLSILATAFAFAGAGAGLAVLFDQVNDVPVLVIVIGSAMTLGFAVPITVATAFSRHCHID
jgi:adenylate cyclase